MPPMCLTNMKWYFGQTPQGLTAAGLAVLFTEWGCTYCTGWNPANQEHARPRSNTPAQSAPLFAGITCLFQHLQEHFSKSVPNWVTSVTRSLWTRHCDLEPWHADKLGHMLTGDVLEVGASPVWDVGKAPPRNVPV